MQYILSVSSCEKPGLAFYAGALLALQECKFFEQNQLAVYSGSGLGNLVIAILYKYVFTTRQTPSLRVANTADRDVCIEQVVEPLLQFCTDNQEWYMLLHRFRYCYQFRWFEEWNAELDSYLIDWLDILLTLTSACSTISTKDEEEEKELSDEKAPIGISTTTTTTSTLLPHRSVPIFIFNAIDQLKHRQLCFTNDVFFPKTGAMSERYLPPLRNPDLSVLLAAIIPLDLECQLECKCVAYLDDYKRIQAWKDREENGFEMLPLSSSNSAKAKAKATYTSISDAYEEESQSRRRYCFPYMLGTSMEVDPYAIIPVQRYFISCKLGMQNRYHNRITEVVQNDPCQCLLLLDAFTGSRLQQSSSAATGWEHLVGAGDLKGENVKLFNRNAICLYHKIPSSEEDSGSGDAKTNEMGQFLSFVYELNIGLSSLDRGMAECLANWGYIVTHKHLHTPQSLLSLPFPDNFHTHYYQLSKYHTH